MAKTCLTGPAGRVPPGAHFRRANRTRRRAGNHCGNRTRRKGKTHRGNRTRRRGGDHRGNRGRRKRRPKRKGAQSGTQGRRREQTRSRHASRARRGNRPPLRERPSRQGGPRPLDAAARPRQQRAQQHDQPPHGGHAPDRGPPQGAAHAAKRPTWGGAQERPAHHFPVTALTPARTASDAPSATAPLFCPKCAARACTQRYTAA